MSSPSSPSSRLSSSKHCSLFTDGASRGNPGPAGAGAVLKDPQGRSLFELAEYLGKMTNNQAEYRALILGLQNAERFGIKRLEVFLDSELIVKQVQGVYRVRHPDLLPLFIEIQALIKNFTHFSIAHVRRDLNQEADLLANQGIDRHYAR